MSNLIPLHLTYGELADVLEDMAKRVRIGDSWEGNIEYVLDDDPDSHTVLVRGVYRIGQSNGSQGGVRMLGRVPTE